MFHKSLSSQQTLEILMSSRDFDIYRSQNDLKIKTSRSSVSRFEKPDHFVRTAFRERKKHVAPSEAARDVSLLWLPSGLESCAISGSPSYPLSPASFAVTHGMPYESRATGEEQEPPSLPRIFVVTGGRER